ncbi:MAG: endonuclease/exonuclease/phosphatase family protein [Phycisphaerales bacterium JB060]
MLKAARVVLAVAAIGLCLCTLLPVIRSTQWWVRAFDFPRVQIAALMVAVLLGQAALGWFAWRKNRKADAASTRSGLAKRGIVPALLVVALAWQCYRIFPYTPLAPVQMERSRDPSSLESIRLLIFNVRYDNRQSLALLRLINETRPDIVLLAEPTHWWHGQLDTLKNDFPFTIEQPQDNHYGLLLYSKLDLVDPEVRFLVEDEVPSLRTGVRLPSGRIVRLIGLHPKPPGLKRPVDPQREDSDQRDAELLTIAKEIKEARDAGDDTPTIVAGDFNDVAWSHTTRLFQRVSGLLDPRIGRGLFNSFNAKSRIHRFPLDHVFASEHFRLVSMEVLPEIGSDHHPVLVEFSLEPTAEATQDEPDPEGNDLEEAEETIREGKEKVREGPGS